MVAFVVLFGVAACATTGDGASSSSVSFDTWDGDPDWSPDGRLIAFASNRGSGGVFVVRPDGTAVRRVFSGEASDVDWSRDGTAIAFTGSRGIYVLRLGDRRAKRVLRGSGLSLPAWAPNGRDLTVVKEESGRFRRYGGAWFTASYPAIYTVRLAGGVPTPPFAALPRRYRRRSTKFGGGAFRNGARVVSRWKADRPPGGRRRDRCRGREERPPHDDQRSRLWQPRVVA